MGQIMNKARDLRGMILVVGAAAMLSACGAIPSGQSSKPQRSAAIQALTQRPPRASVLAHWAKPTSGFLRCRIATLPEDAVRLTASHCSMWAQKLPTLDQ